MRYISLFSGIEAATVAWEPLGWEPVAFCEIDEFPSAVLEYRFPNVPNLGDITKVDWSDYVGSVDIIVGGSPCQSFSIAGKREGLKGESGLMFEYIRAVREVRPRWFIWENVSGALSSEKGAAFRQLLAEMDDLGYGLAWRVLDAQFFGVAQRRRRVFLVGSLGDQRAAEVLFEPDGLRWDHPSSREKREELTRAAADRAQEGGGGCLTPWDTQTLFQPSAFAFAQNTRDEVRFINGDGNLSGALAANPGMKQTSYVLIEQPTVVIDRAAFNQGVNAQYDPPHRADGRDGHPRGARPHAVYMASGQANAEAECDMTPAMATTEYVTRRLTPRECERLQGFPDDWTLIPYKGKPADQCPDTPRYKALGNSFAVPVVRWIGERIQMVESEGE